MVANPRFNNVGQNADVINTRISIVIGILTVIVAVSTSYFYYYFNTEDINLLSHLITDLLHCSIFLFVVPLVLLISNSDYRRFMLKMLNIRNWTQKFKNSQNSEISASNGLSPLVVSAVKFKLGDRTSVREEKDGMDVE